MGGFNWDRERERQKLAQDIATPKVTQRLKLTGEEVGAFWRAWRKEGKALREAGYAVRKIDGKWTIWRTA